MSQARFVYIVMLTPVSLPAMPGGARLVALRGAGAGGGAERVRWRRERKERVMDFMVIVWVLLGLGGWWCCAVLYKGREDLEREE